MYSKLLVPLDGSRLSEGILPHARSLAKALSVPLELLQVIDWGAIAAIRSWLSAPISPDPKFLSM